MRRVGLFEFEDFSWFPCTIRDLVTDYLRFVTVQFRLYEPVVERLRAALERARADRIVDLCSGGGGVLPTVQEKLVARTGAPISVVFTDRFPNRAALRQICEASPETRSFVGESVDASDVPPHLGGFRTLFSALHHFEPASARRILGDAVRQRTGIAIFEFSERSLLGVLRMLLMPLGVLFFTPLIRPLTLGRIVWTYLVPVVPLIVLWDGLVSSLRTYSLDELRDMIAELGESGFRWDVGRVAAGRGLSVTHLVGCPSA